MAKRIKYLTILFWTVMFSRLIPMVFLPLTDTTEARYANTALLMAKFNDWITPYFDYCVPFWGKPPLSFWFQALSYDIFGIHDFTPRFPSFVITLVTAWLIYKLVITLYDKFTAMLAITIYASMLLVFALSGAVLTDTYLTFATTLSLVSFVMVLHGYKKYWDYLFFVGLGLGILTKGPLAVVIVGGIITLWILLSFKKRIQVIGKFPLFSGTLLMLLISIPWYIMAEIKTPGFLHYFILGENFGRFLDTGWHGDKYGSPHVHAYGAIWLMWLEASFPWGISMVYLFFKGLKKKLDLRVLSEVFHSEPYSFYIIWALFIPLFFSIARNTLWTYILPSLPAFAILLALYINHYKLYTFKFILINTLFVPVVVMIGLIYVSYHPNTIKTEKFLIAKYHTLAKHHEPLYFLMDRSFSSEYYMNKKLDIISVKQLHDLEKEHTNKRWFIAVNKTHKQFIDKQYFKRIFVSKKYILFENRGTK